MPVLTATSGAQSVRGNLLAVFLSYLETKTYLLRTW
jgi:hypothetical protein